MLGLLQYVIKMEEFKVTPWEVEGSVDYERLVKQFGLNLVDKSILEKFKKITGELHFMLRRGVFFAQRDLDFIFKEHSKGNNFYLYTGRGPSESVHLGHLLPLTFTKYLQDKFKSKCIIQLTDDEKFLFKQNISPKQAYDIAYDNALDMIALGFDKKRTKIIIDTNYSKTLYNHAIRVAKHITFSTTKAVFGFENSTNIGSIFYTSIQAVPAFLESVEQGKNIPCLIPHGVDQDPHFRIARDVLPKLGYYKPASIQNKLLPGLLEGGKMSASVPNSAIFVTDTPAMIKKKINNAFSGGQATVEEHRKKGGNPEIDIPFQYLKFFFEPDDSKLKKIEEDYRSGKMLTGELKQIAIEKITKFILAHQEKREKAKDEIEDFLLKD